MEEKEKTVAQLEARLRSFDQTLTEIKKTAEKRGTSLPNDSQELIPDIERKHDIARENIQRLNGRQGKEWQDACKELTRFMDDMDESLRKALAYFS